MGRLPLYWQITHRILQRLCNHPMIGGYKDNHVSINGIPSGNKRWYGPVYIINKRQVNIRQGKGNDRVTFISKMWSPRQKQQISPEYYVCPGRTESVQQQLLHPVTAGHVRRNLTSILCVQYTLMVNSIF